MRATFGLVPTLVICLLICWQMSCESLWKPFGYSEPDNCTLHPEVCGAGMECNGQREVCELSAPLPTLSQLVWGQQEKLQVSDAAVADALGVALSLSAETALIGAPLADKSGVVINSGAVYVLVHDTQSGLWTQQAKLFPSDSASNDLVGFSVSLSADTALLSAHLADPGGVSDQGAAYVFVRDAAQGWTQQAKLVADDGKSGDLLGYAVSLSGDTALLGAEAADLGINTDAGAAYVFVRNSQSGTWVQAPRLVAADAASGDALGHAVSVSGTTALVGAYQADRGEKTDAGAAYVFVRDAASGTWTQQAKLVGSDITTGDNFGVAVAIDGDTAIIGAAKADPGGHTDAGAAYVFVRDAASGTWTQQAKLIGSGGTAGELFGTAVALSGNRAAVTANQAATQGQVNAGAVYVFTRLPGQTSWTREAKLAAADAATNDRAGVGVALRGNTLLYGAPTKSQGSILAAGAAYVFVFKRPGGDPCQNGQDCLSTFCVDGVCCNSACGGGDTNDCQVCSAAAGGILGQDGSCGPRRGGRLCRASVSISDPPESCDGQSLSCPPDVGG